MLCGLVSLILVFVMAVPMTVSAAEATKVSTAEELQTAVEAGGDIVLDADITASITIPAGKTVTLDLNGHKLTNTAGNHTIINEGTLTIKGNGTVDNVSHGTGALFNEGTATINGGNFIRSKESATSLEKRTDNSNSWYVIYNQGTLTVNGGSVKNNSYYSSLLENINGTLNVNGGTFENGDITLKNDENGIMNITAGAIKSDSQAVQNWSKLTVTGGTLEGKVHTWSYSSTNQGVTTIGGNARVNGDVSAIQYDDATMVSTVIIKGGTISGVIEKAKFRSTGGGYVSQKPEVTTCEIIISGGTFDNRPAEELIVQDKVAIKFKRGDDEKYYVGTEQGIQEIVNSAKSGDQIDVIKGNVKLTITTPGVTIGNNGGTVVVNDQELADGTTVTIPEKSEPTAPSQDPSQKPADNAKADKNAATGDDFNMLAAGGAALAAIIAMAAVVITGRRQRQK